MKPPYVLSGPILSEDGMPIPASLEVLVTTSRASVDRQELRELSLHPSPTVRNAVAGNRYTPGWILCGMTADQRVWSSLVRNPSVPPQVLVRILRQGGDVFALAIAENPSADLVTLLRACLKARPIWGDGEAWDDLVDALREQRGRAGRIAAAASGQVSVVRGRLQEEAQRLLLDLLAG